MHSMTGFGRGQATHQGYTVYVDLRSLNGRFCEVRVRGLTEFPALASQVEEKIQQAFARGTLEAFVRWNWHGEARPKRALPSVAQRYYAELVQLQRELGLDHPPTLDHLLQLGVFQEETELEEALAIPLHAALAMAIEQVKAQREREGAKLQEALRREVRVLRELWAQAQAQAPQALHAAEERLKARLAELALDPDPSRIAAELVLWAERSDVREELDRMASHIHRLEALLDQEGPVGKELEFLAQELAREASTLSAKARSTVLAQTALEMRLAVERLREQGRNVE